MNDQFTQFLIAQSLMDRPCFQAYDYEEIWTTAGRLLPGYLSSELSSKGTPFQMVEHYLDTIPMTQL